MTITIAIDGPAASGKGSIAARVADYFRLPHLDTGLLYRGVAAMMVSQNIPLNDENAALQCAHNLQIHALDEEMLSRRHMGEAASQIAIMPSVRKALLELQQNFASRPEGAVLDGRDIGTIICPRAEVKIFVNAAVDTRARRRWAQLVSGGEDVSLQEIVSDLKKRDERDRNRTIAPLRPAADAHLLDTTNLDIESSVKSAIEIVERKIPRLKQA